MTILIQDSHFGRLLRYASRGRLLPSTEDQDPALVKRFSLDASSADVDSATSHNLSTDEQTAEKGGNGKKDDGHIVGWYGSDDPENPQNWSKATKGFVTFQLCFLTFAVYVGSSIYTPGIPDVMATLDVGEVVATLGLSVFVLGYALGPMTLAPVAEMPSTGRNLIYIYTLALFVVLQVPTALSVHIAMLIIFRFVTGVLGAPALSIGGASLSEMYKPQDRALPMGLWGLSAVCGPVLGPLIGGYATQNHGWRWTIWLLMAISGAAFVLLFFLLPETSSKNILARRAERLRKLTGNETLTTQAEIGFKYVTLGKIAQMMVVRPWILTFGELIVFLLNLWVALIFGILFIWFYSIPLVLETIYGFGPGSTGLAFLGLLVGALVTLPFFIYYVLKIQRKQFNEKGEIIQPEMRLPPAMVGGVFIPICLFWFAWTANQSVHWIVPVIGTAFFSSGVLYILSSVLTYLPDAYPADIPSVMAGNTFVRFAAGAGFPLFAPAMYNKLGIHWATTLLALLALVFAAIPFLFYKFGAKIRKASKRARQD